jgi:hypothetical protein
MRKYAFLIVAAVAVLAVPSAASAQATPDCPDALVPTSPTGGTSKVYVSPGSSLVNGTVAVGVCVDFEGTVTNGPDRFDGGRVEVGANATRGVAPDPFQPVGPGNNHVGDPSGNVLGVPGAYVFVDGDNDNNNPFNCPTECSDRGYVGLSNYESSGNNEEQAGDGTGETVDNCVQAGPTPTDVDDDSGPQPNGGDSNSGGCLTVRDPSTEATVVALPVPLVACGNDSGQDWWDAKRDGCSIP